MYKGFGFWVGRGRGRLFASPPHLPSSGRYHPRARSSHSGTACLRRAARIKDRCLAQRPQTFALTPTMRAVYKILPLLGALYLVHWRWRARDACAGWDPGSDADAPGCLRAQQYREFQAFWASNSSLDDINFHALAGAERCVPGITHCPPRPLVIIDYRYWNRAARDRAGPGEVMWGWTVDAVLVLAKRNDYFPLRRGGLRMCLRACATPLRRRSCDDRAAFDEYHGLSRAACGDGAGGRKSRGHIWRFWGARARSWGSGSRRSVRHRMRRCEWGEGVRWKTRGGRGDEMTTINTSYRGVPVVLAYIKPDPEGWEVFYDKAVQHGPVMALGEP
ncbi:unnamed protein product [Cutaneotrichosporon oleaginosum]